MGHQLTLKQRTNEAARCVPGRSLGIHFALRSAGNWILASPSSRAYLLLASFTSYDVMVVKRCCLHQFLCYSHRVMARHETRRNGRGCVDFREVPADVIVKAKIEAALQGKSVKVCSLTSSKNTGRKLEKKGVLPRGSEPYLEKDTPVTLLRSVSSFFFLSLGRLWMILRNCRKRSPHVEIFR